VIEILPLVEPLVGKVAVAILHQRRVDRENVLLTADGLHVVLDGGEGVLEVLLNRERVPSLPDLRVKVMGHIQILIYLGKGLVGHLI
jgi:hypothetical protein